MASFKIFSLNSSLMDFFLTRSTLTPRIFDNSISSSINFRKIGQYCEDAQYLMGFALNVEQKSSKGENDVIRRFIRVNMNGNTGFLF